MGVEGCGVTPGGHGGGIGGGVLEIPVWVVFDNYHVVLYAERVDVFAALDSKSTRRWVLANPSSMLAVDLGFVGLTAHVTV